MPLPMVPAPATKTFLMFMALLAARLSLVLRRLTCPASARQSLQLADLPALALVGGAGGCLGVRAQERAALQLFGCRRRGDVGVEPASLGLRHVPVGEGLHEHDLTPSAGARDLDLVGHLHELVRLRRLAVDADLPAAAGALRLRPRLVETR